MAIASTAATGILGFSARVQVKKSNVDNVVKMFWGLFIGTVAAILLATVIPSAILKRAFGVV